VSAYPSSRESDALNAAARPWTLRDYGFIADGERGALIGPHGDIAWMCAPNWDSDAVFGELIGAPGRYAVTPLEPCVWGGYYEDRSLIWRSRWVTSSAIIECREALAFPGRPDEVVLLRRIEAIRGDAHLAIRLQPGAGFGCDRMRDPRRRDGEDCWEASLGAMRMRWSGAPWVVVTGDDATSRALDTTVVVGEGQQMDLVLELSAHELADRPPAAAALWAETEKVWKEAVPVLGPTAAPRDATHSYAVMRGMTAQTGAMVAAATMSLPERADEGANYDYRYAWIRDQCYAGLAVAADGPHELLDSAVKFVSGRLLADGPDLMPAYTVAGGAVPEQRRLALSGYPGGYDLAGNHVRKQFQLDIFGEALLLFAAAARHDRFDRDARRAVDLAVGTIDRCVDRPDAGIWELDARHWTHSRLACAAGLRAAAEAGICASARRSLELADSIVADTASTCRHPSGRWQRARDDPRVDGALLLPAVRGALPGDDPCSVATYRAVKRELSRDHYVYRYRPEKGLGSTDSAFLLCGFVMALASLQQGRTVEAFRYFERNRAGCGTPGLFSEEYDIRQRQLRGNLPQAFVHALLFEASSTLARHTEADMTTTERQQETLQERKL